MRDAAPAASAGSEGDAAAEDQTVGGVIKDHALAGSDNPLWLKPVHHHLVSATGVSGVLEGRRVGVAMGTALHPQLPCNRSMGPHHLTDALLGTQQEILAAHRDTGRLTVDAADVTLRASTGQTETHGGRSHWWHWTGM